MTSILKVDQLQKSNGTAPSVSDLGITEVGKIIQVAHHKWNVMTEITSTAWTDCNSSYFTFTPKKATSLLLIVLDGQFEYKSNSGMGLRIIHNGAVVNAPGQTHELYDVSTGDTYTRSSKHETVSAGSTLARTIGLQIASYTGNSIRCCTGGLFYSTFTVYEIEQ